MKKLITSICVVACMSANAKDFTYPKTKSVDHKDVYHGTTVADPYRWLEDDVRNSEDVANWVDAQNAVTQDYIDALPYREKIKESLTDLWNYERFSTPEVYGDAIFYLKNDGLQNQSVLYVEKDGKSKVLIDPNAWAKDGTGALASYVVSPKGTYVAYAIQKGGSDWRNWKVLNVESGETLNDDLDWLKFNDVAWNSDESGFFYSRFPEPEEGQEFQSLNFDMAVYHHRLGDAQSKDTLVYTNKDNPEWGYSNYVTSNGRWLLITVWHGTDNRYQVLYKDLTKKGAKPTFLAKGFNYEYSIVGSRGDTVYFQTTESAPRKRIVSIDLGADALSWKEEVPEQKSVLDEASLSKSSIIAHYMEDAKSALYEIEASGTRKKLALPTIGSVGGINTSSKSDDVYYSFSSFNYPTTIFKTSLADDKTQVYRKPNVKFNPEDFIVEQVFYTSKDGTKVPMTISRLKSNVNKTNLPTLLYGYGGFNVSLLPRFSLERLTWMKMGGVYVQANIRGGGEYGQTWHKAGTKLQKQNVFDDFIAAGEYLIENDITSSEKMAIFGGSNGGLLVGAVTNQRPDLFAAAVPAVGVMDMLRFHQFTAGRYWVDDYGSADNPKEFNVLYQYSPYHNVEKGTEYPAVLVLTADTDDRVVPGHSFKYIAALQAAQAGPAPVMIRIDKNAGHGAGTPTEKKINQYADVWAFLAKNLNMKVAL
ncbi:prolyl oligopeptidase family serine peptidase [Aestuariibacter sp. AA17]|uniref:prolyl oligopeptidase n=1 Tax=Fluctibacter corallii TaxID=2984329 RepID=A0ABT3A940_9ALTE|nr:prolyl oligopeptidase family serine peptidase [Aestuariibacter sp. AA17]MCV2885125.1 prolyl oligopeptidase family serine peptidase [Aestuariibacter sp. AA17]